MKVAIIRNDHLGDLILTTPLFRVLSEAGHKVTAIAPAAFYRILEGNPFIEKLRNIEDIAPSFPRNWPGLGKYLRHDHFDAVLLPLGRPKELIWASTASLAKIKIALWGGLWGRILGHVCLKSRIFENPRPYATIVLELARELGVKPISHLPEIYLTEEEREEARSLLSKKLGNQRVICLHPGSAGSACNLPTQEYAHAAEILLRSTDCNIVVTGTAKESALIKEWPAKLLESGRVWHSFGQLDIRGFAAVISQCHLVLCPSTSALHIGTALGVPTISPFCGRPGLTSKIWGGHAPRSCSVETDPANCAEYIKKGQTRCDFRGEISGAQLADRALGFLRL